jgi:protein tyrosine phosphatase
MRKRQTPTDEAVGRFLDVATDPARQPVYVYCKAGVHRTGSLVAVYRIAVDGWTPNDATKEMDAFGFDSMFGLQDGFKEYVVEYERRLKADPTSVPRPIQAVNVAK